MAKAAALRTTSLVRDILNNGQNIVTALEEIDKHCDAEDGTPPHLSVCDWHSLRMGIKPLIPDAGHPNRPEWITRYMTTLYLTIVDLSLTRNSQLSYGERLKWLEQIVIELSPSEFIRQSLIWDSEPGFKLYVLPLISMAMPIARELGSREFVDRLERYKRPVLPSPRAPQRLELRHMSVTGVPIAEARGPHATTAILHLLP
jgi:hypothetical protein